MRIQRCFFCQKPVYPGHGITFVRNDSKVFDFCASKCRVNFNKKRNPRKTRWTKAFRKANGKELTVDNSLEFEKRRNEPVKYSRELWKNTIDAMEKIDKIKSKREAHFIMKRLDKGVKDRKEDDLREVKVNLAMVRAPGAKESRLDNILESKLGIVSARKKAEEIKIVDTRQESEAAKKKELEMEVEV
jgi:large subunit ribosomal protein L24e